MIAYAIDAMQLSLPNAAMYIVLYKSLVRARACVHACNAGAAQLCALRRTPSPESYDT